MQKIVERDEGQVLKKAKINEFEFGLRPDRTKIGQYSNDNYAFKKHLQNPLAGYGQVDLIKTGAFVNSLFVLPLGQGRFVFDSNNNKAGMLTEAYGKDIFGLNRNTFRKVEVQYYAPKLRQYTLSLLKK